VPHCAGLDKQQSGPLRPPSSRSAFAETPTRPYADTGPLLLRLPNAMTNGGLPVDVDAGVVNFGGKIIVLEIDVRLMNKFKSLRASSLYCPKCKTAQPVRERLLLILPDRELYDYLCSSCATSVGTREVRATELPHPPLIVQ
jgi:hypothetical protein